MTEEKVREVAMKYWWALSDAEYNATRFPSLGRTVASPYDALCHARWMCGQIAQLCDEGRIEKAMRWLGFVQGTLWSWGFRTIDEMKNDNKPEKEG